MVHNSITVHGPGNSDSNNAMCVPGLSRSRASTARHVGFAWIVCPPRASQALGPAGRCWRDAGEQIILLLMSSVNGSSA